MTSNQTVNVTLTPGSLQQVLFDSVPGLFAVVDLQLRLVAANCAYRDELARRTGRPAVLGLMVEELLQDEPALLTAALALWSRALSGESFSIERVVPWADGRTRIWVIAFNPVTDDAGAIVGAMHAARDVTDQRQAEDEAAALRAELEARVEDRTRALRMSDQRLSLLTEIAPQLFWSATADGAVDYVNERWCETTGLAASCATGAGWLDVVHADDRARVAEAWQRTIKEGAPFDVIHRVRRHDGAWRWFLSRCHPKVDELRTVGWYGSSTDIHEQKLAEQRLAEALDQVQREQERLLVTLRSIGEGVIVTDTNGRITHMNAAAEQTLRMDAATALGQPIDEVVRLGVAETGEPLTVPLAAALGTGAPTRSPYGAVLLRSDGSERRVELHASPMLSEYGAVLGGVLALRDVTDVMRASEELQKASTLESIGRLAGGLAHDFNNLLTGVLGNLSILQHTMRRDEANTQRLDAAIAAARRASELTRQLLTFAKGGAPVRRRARLDELIRDVCAFTAAGSAVRIEVDTPADLWPAAIDESQIGQVVHNIVLNAEQASAPGALVQINAVNRRVTERTRLPLAPGRYVRVRVTDQGCGIPRENLRRIFDPFFTTRHGGSGLGLATAYSILRRHDGHISVRSQPGAGTTIVFYVPASADEAPERPSAETVTAGVGRVLVMDDLAIMRETFDQMLTALGYGCDAAIDGREAIAAYEDAMRSGAPYDAVILDLTVPGGMGGREAISHLLRADPGVRAIVTSGYSDDPVLDHLSEHGFRASLPKPFTLADLRRALALALDEVSG